MSAWPAAAARCRPALSFFVLGFLASRNLSTASFSPCTMASFNLDHNLVNRVLTQTGGYTWVYPLGLPFAHDAASRSPGQGGVLAGCCDTTQQFGLCFLLFSLHCLFTFSTAHAPFRRAKWLPSETNVTLARDFSDCARAQAKASSYGATKLLACGRVTQEEGRGVKWLLQNACPFARHDEHPLCLS